MESLHLSGWVEWGVRGDETLEPGVEWNSGAVRDPRAQEEPSQLYPATHFPHRSTVGFYNNAILEKKSYLT